MQSILSTLFDSHHLFNPRQLDKIGDHHEPTLFRRILGVVILALSFPLTLGLAPAFFAYWAHRKVVHIEQRDRTELQERTDYIFGKRVQGVEPSLGQTTFETAFKAIQKGRGLEALPDDMDNELTAELMDAALEYDNIAAVIALMDKYDDIQIDFTKVKSGRMACAILKKIPEGVRSEVVNERVDNENNSALHLQQNLAVIKELVKAGAEFRTNNYSESPLHKCQDPEIAKYFIEEFKSECEGSDFDLVNQPNFQGYTPLLTASSAVMRVLIAEGADVMPKSGSNTIFHRFGEEALCNDVELANLILSKITDSEYKVRFLNVSLMQLLLSDKANVEVIKALVDAGAECPEMAVFQEIHNPEVARCLMGAFAWQFNHNVAEGELSPLFFVENAEILKVLIEDGLNVQATDSNGKTILHRMGEPAFRDHPELVSLIVGKVDEDERKDFVNCLTLNPRQSPMSSNPGPKMIKALKDAGAHYPRFIGGQTFLHFEIDLETAKALIESYGVDIVNQKDDQGFTPIFSPDISPEVAQFLIAEYGLKVDVKDKAGKEPIHYINENNLERAKILIGDRRSDHDWGDDIPAVMKNPEFIAWLHEREAQ